ncbi:MULTISPECIES: hypothetical protein [unclassified Aureispira]|uniref:hypothetical protein n=1 Tax=unclassified Aureispira TaxID=2649989 RepID=UPI0012DD90BC|nr:MULTISPECIES: hypothetical protein [unclassified Aureispira]WMX17598.1 hypothetical protein QP953_28355 [Aureispira sp. CCB-E]
MKSLIVCQTLYAESTEIGSGAFVALDKATPPIINLLKRSYLNDPQTLIGDIPYLFSL